MHNQVSPGHEPISAVAQKRDFVCEFVDRPVHTQNMGELTSLERHGISHVFYIERTVGAFLLTFVDHRRGFIDAFHLVAQCPDLVDKTPRPTPNIEEPTKMGVGLRGLDNRLRLVI
jgi:hypothetical protein